MKAARVLLFVYRALLIIAIGCGGNSTTSQTGTPPNSGGSGSGGGGGNGGGSPSEFLFTIENPNAASSVEAFGISSNGALAHVSSTNATFNAADIVANSKFVVVANTPLFQNSRQPIQVTSYSIGSS